MHACVFCVCVCVCVCVRILRCVLLWSSLPHSAEIHTSVFVQSAGKKKVGDVCNYKYSQHQECAPLSVSQTVGG